MITMEKFKKNSPEIKHVFVTFSGINNINALRQSFKLKEKSKHHNELLATEITW